MKEKRNCKKKKIVQFIHGLNMGGAETLVKDYVLGFDKEKYDVSESQDIYACLEEIAKNRHCLVRGSELDMEKAARLLLDDFRNGRIGRITLEFPQDYEETDGE